MAFKWQLSSHFWASCSFRQQLQISLSEENFQRIAAREPENLLSQGRLVCEQVFAQVFAHPYPDRLTLVNRHKMIWIRSFCDPLYLWKGCIRNSCCLRIGSCNRPLDIPLLFPAKKDLGRGENLFPCIQGGWWQGTWNSRNIKLITVAIRKGFVIFTWML